MLKPRTFFSPHLMDKPRSCFPANFISSFIFGCSVIPFAILFLNLGNVANGIDQFDPLIELPRPTSEYLRNSSSNESTVFYVNDFGAQGNGLIDDTEAFQEVWQVACSWSEPSTIVVPAGKEFLVRPINFAGPCKSRVTLRISGTIVAPADPDCWKGWDPNKWLYFHGVKYLTVEGRGTVDGNGHQWWARSCKVNRTNPCHHAPKAMTFHRCKGVTVRQIMVMNSQQMHMAFTTCKQVSVSHLSIFAPWNSPNTDGIHISASTNVEIKTSVIRTGDDCISIVSNSSSIQIRDITCGPGHGISIGSLGKNKCWDQVHDVYVNGVAISNTENGLRIKSWQGGSGYVKNITFENVMLDNVSNPIIIDQYYCDSFKPCSNQTLAVNVSDVSYIGIKGTSATEEAIKFTCSDSSPCTGLYLEDIEIVPYAGENITSTCWQAYGTSVGLVYPPPCFSCANNNLIIQPIARSNSTKFI